jgi:far upstream element-binding protein
LKNGSGGSRNRAPQQLDYGDRNYQQQSYGAPQAQTPQAQAQAPASTGGEDPYAACKHEGQVHCSKLKLIRIDGGYQAYVALWYQAMAAQQQGGQIQGDQSKPPGTA